jgi:hypothetical protein
LNRTKCNLSPLWSNYWRSLYCFSA